MNATGGVVARYVDGRDVDEPLAMQRGNTTDYYETDGLGSVTSLTDTTGAVAQTYTYDSFGSMTNSSGTLTNFFRYTTRRVAHPSRVRTQPPLGVAGAASLCALRKGCVATRQDQPRFPRAFDLTALAPLTLFPLWNW